MSGFSEYDRHDAAAILSMNRPEALNAFSSTGLSESR